MAELASIENPAKPQPLLEGRKGELLGQLDVRVNSLRRFQEALGSIDSNGEHASVSQKLTGYLATEIGSYSVDIQNAVERYGIASEEQRILLDKVNSRPGLAYRDSPTLEDEATTEDQINSLYEELALLRQNPDVIFLVELSTAVNNLIEKNKTVIEIGGKAKQVNKYISGLQGESASFDIPKIKKIIRGPFSISVVLDRDYFSQRYSRSVRGIHIPNSPINVIRDMPKEEIEKTIRHEDIHNLLDHSKHSRNSDMRLFRHRLEKYKSYRDRDLPAPIMQKQLSLIEDVGPSKFVDSVHEEILAHIQNLERSNFVPKMDKFETAVSLLLGVKPAQDFFSLTNMFSTAGGEVYKFFSLLSNEANNNKDPELSAICRSQLVNLEKYWTGFVNGMQSTFDMARNINERAVEDVHLLFYILQPSQFHHARSYLEYKYGKTPQVDEKESAGADVAA